VFILFLGIGIMPRRVAGDKNFLLDLSDFLTRNQVSHHFASIAGKPDFADLQSDIITYLPRPFHGNPTRYYYRSTGGSFFGYHHKHTNLREYIEVSSALVYHVATLRALLRPYSQVIVQWMDMSGLVPVVRFACGARARYLCLVPRYVPQGPFGNWLRGWALQYADQLITSTNASKELLVQHRCRRERIAVTPWGSRGIVSREQDATIFTRAPQSKTRLIWAGYIQQIQSEDFLAAIALAQQVVAVRADIEFTFCLKPESFKSEFQIFQRPGIRIEKGDAHFLDNLINYDGFFSPVLHTQSALAPPLTWIEALSVGVPVITTRCQGITELLTEGKSALIFSDYQSIQQWLMSETRLDQKLRAMRNFAKQEFDQRYNIEIVGARYLDLYRRLVEQ
jgi:glycosyltransferase involved in cell wall biosynthesis